MLFSKSFGTNSLSVLRLMSRYLMTPCFALDILNTPTGWKSAPFQVYISESMLAMDLVCGGGLYTLTAPHSEPLKLTAKQHTFSPAHLTMAMS